MTNGRSGKNQVVGVAISVSVANHVGVSAANVFLHMGLADLAVGVAVWAWPCFGCGRGVWAWLCGRVRSPR